MIQRTLACRACNSSEINTRMDGTYRCQDCDDVGEPIERAPKGYGPDGKESPRVADTIQRMRNVLREGEQ